MAKAKSNTNVNVDPSSLSGMHIYRDDKGRTLYYKPRTMTGYVITSTDVATYRTLSKRIALGIIGAVLTALFTDGTQFSWLIAAVVGLGIYIFLEIRFRTKFLKNLVQVHNFIPKEKPTYIEAIAKDTISRLLLKAFLYFAFGTLLILDIYIELKPSLFMMIILWVISLASMIFGCVNIYGVFYQKKHPEIFMDPHTKNKKSKK